MRQAHIHPNSCMNLKCPNAARKRQKGCEREWERRKNKCEKINNFDIAGCNQNESIIHKCCKSVDVSLYVHTRVHTPHVWCARVIVYTRAFTNSFLYVYIHITDIDSNRDSSLLHGSNDRISDVATAGTGKIPRNRTDIQDTWVCVYYCVHLGSKLHV